MPRPPPLTSVATGRPSTSDYNVLTPRTPHSRSGRAEEAHIDVELEGMNELDDDHRSYSQQQAEPLLASSDSGTFPPFGYRSQGDEYDPNHWNSGRVKGLSFAIILSRIPLVAGSAMAGLLFVLIVISINRPDALDRYLGVTETAPATIILPTESAAPNEDLAPPSPSPSHPNPHIISYENYTKFPLLPTEYLAECHKLNKGFASHGEYWEPHSNGTLDVLHHDDNHDYVLPEGGITSVCKSTITYMLDGQVGLLADLALMAQAAAFARERNRTFLIDDTYWNRGKWLDHFQDVRARQPGPEPGCRAPPPEELVACPRLARHWVINSRTAKSHFAHGFSNAYEDPYAHQLNRLKPIFDRAHQAFVETIRPNAHNAQLIRSARSELSQVISSAYDRSDLQRRGRNGAGHDHDGNDSPYISVHLRRGDRYPASFNYNNGYVPISDYTQAVMDTWKKMNANASSLADGTTVNPVVYIASDSPSAHDELSSSLPPNTTFSLLQSKDPELQALASTRDYVQKEFNTLESVARINATRGMILDFAMISGMWAWEAELLPDATVCTISSNVCKLAAVGLGWDRAFGAVDDMGMVDKEGMRWIDVDQKGQIIPVWSPFELFY